MTEILTTRLIIDNNKMEIEEGEEIFVTEKSRNFVHDKDNHFDALAWFKNSNRPVESEPFYQAIFDKLNGKSNNHSQIDQILSEYVINISTAI